MSHQRQTKYDPNIGITKTEEARGCFRSRVGGVKNAGLVRVVSTWWTAVINREGVSCM